MADVFDFYVLDNRKITFQIAEPIMREDSGVTDFRFHIPKSINNLDMSDWSWWFVFVNAKKEKYSIALELSDDPESPLEKNVATYTVDYAMSIKAGSVQFALEAINAGTGGTIDNEWHTLTYETKVKETLQGNQAEYAETESDIISALLEEVQRRVNQLVGGATPEPVSLIANMTDMSKVYLYVGEESGESTNYWYYYNGSAWIAGGLYASGITVDAVPIQESNNAVRSGGVYSALADKVAKPTTNPNGTSGQLLQTLGNGQTQWTDYGLPTDAQTAEAVSGWLDEHPEATTTVQDGAITYAKLNNAVKVGVTCSALGMTTADNNGDNFQILVNAINTGKTILVDGLYMLTCDKDVCAEITENVNLIGITPDAEFQFATGQNIFGPTGNIDITIINVAFKTHGSLYILTLFYINPADATSVKIGKMYIENCKFYRTGTLGIRLLDYAMENNTAPSALFGIDKLIFRHNFCDNVKTNFIQLSDVPIRRAEIISNYVHNHDYCLYYAEIKNGGTYAEAIKESRGILAVKDNVVYNDDDYWCAVSNFNYCCFIVSECTTIYYVNNHVEGIHSENNVVLLDIYMTGKYNYKVGNEMINCACYAELTDYSDASIFRCKGTEKHALWKNNVYIVEDDYATRVGKTGVMSNAIFMLGGEGTDGVVFEDNYVYAQTIVGMDFGNKNISLTMNRNTIIAKKWNGKRLYIMTHGFCKSVEMNGNKIKIGEATGSCALIGGGSVPSSFNGNQIERIEFCNNIVEIGTYNRTSGEKGIINDLMANKIDISGNRFVITTETTDFDLMKSVHARDMLTVRNNFIERQKPYVLEISSGFNILPYADIYEATVIASDAVSSNFDFDDSNIRHLGDSSMPYSSTFETFEYEVMTPTEIKRYSYELLHYMDNGTEKIRVTKDGDVILDDTSPTDNYVDSVIVEDSYFRFLVRRQKAGTTYMYRKIHRWKSLPAYSKVHVVHRSCKPFASS